MLISWFCIVFQRIKSYPKQNKSPRAISRCSLSYFATVVKKISAEQKLLIDRLGFGPLLEFVDCSVPRYFAKWIAEKVDVINHDILAGGKRIRISPESVHKVVGIPLGGKDVLSDAEDAKSSFLALFGLSTLPNIKFFGDKIIRGGLCDDEFIRCFMVVALSTFLCPTSSTLPSPKYVGALLDIKDIKNYNWSKFVFEWLILYIKKYQKNMLKTSQSTNTLGGCIYKLAVSFLFDMLLVLCMSSCFEFYFLLISFSCRCFILTF